MSVSSICVVLLFSVQFRYRCIAWPSSAQQVGCLCIVLPLHGFNNHQLAALGLIPIKKPSITQTVDQLFRAGRKLISQIVPTHMPVKRIKDLSTDPEDPSKHKLDMESNLTVCENVGFEMRDAVPGLAFSRDRSQGWTPVVHQKKRRQIRKMTPTRSTNAESSEEELESCVWKAKQVEYQIRDGMPGHEMACQGTRWGLPTNWNVKWTPVIPSPN